METSLRRTNVLLVLAQGDPEAAREQLRRARWTPPAGAFHVQHWYELEARTELALFEDAAAAALVELAPSYHQFRRSLLPRLQLLRAVATWLRARLLLSAAAADTGDQSRRLAEASRLGRRLARESVGFPHAWSRMISAAVASRRGRPERATRDLREAIDLAIAFDMELVAATARHRLGELLGGAEGAALIAHAGEWMTRERIGNHARMLALVAPGFATPEKPGGTQP